MPKRATADQPRRGVALLAFSDSDLATPPSEFLIFAFGKTETTKGSYDFDQESAAKVMRAANDYGNRLTIDYEHQALSDPPVKAPAAGRYQLEVREDGLWAVSVEWTKEAAEYLANKEYLYYSPAFIMDKKGRPERLLNIALTNLPATKHMTPLVAAKDADGDDDGDEEIDMKKCSSCAKDMGDGDELYCKMCYSANKMMSQLTVLTGKQTNDESLAVVQGWKIAAEEVNTLRARIEKTERDAELAAFDAEIVGAKVKALLASSDDHKRNKAALAFRAQPGGLVALKSFLSAFDPLVEQPGAKTAVEPAPLTAGAVVLNAAEKLIAKRMGVSLEALAKNKARRLALAAEPDTRVPLSPEEEAEDDVANGAA